MYKLIIASIFVLITLNASSQDMSYKGMKELSITTNNIIGGDFDLKYRKGLNENLFLTLGLVNLNALYRVTTYSNTTLFPRNELSIRGGLALGLEKRKMISDVFSFMYGFDLRGSTSYYRSYKDDPNQSYELRIQKRYLYNPGIGLSMGAMMKLSDQFYISAELNPSINYSSTIEEREINDELTTIRESGINYNSSSEVVRLGFVYRWK